VTRRTQVDRAIEALLKGWLSPRQLTAASGRANPNGIIRDAKAEAARRGLVWREMWVKSAETGCRYKMHHVERESSEGCGEHSTPRDLPPARPGPRGGAQGILAGGSRTHDGQRLAPVKRKGTLFG